MAKGRRKPSDPQEIARRRAEAAATQTEVERLRATGATVTLDRSRRIVSAYRQSPFVRLREGGAITAGQAEAAERLCDDWAVWKGLDGRPERLEIPVEGYGAAELITDRMMAAGARVRLAMLNIGPLDRELLAALVASSVEADRPLPWRDIVRRVSGVTQTTRQSQMIVGALENLARVYRDGGRSIAS